MTPLEVLALRYPTANFAGPSPIDLPGGLRTHLPGLFADLGYTRGAEIGVWRGEFSERLCAENPALHLFCVDPWQAYPGYLAPSGVELASDAYGQAQVRLAPYRVTILKKSSLAALEDIPDDSLDFVYIDGNHSFLHVVQDLEGWSQKVKPGGIVAGHDYHRFRPTLNLHVVEAVNGFTEAYLIRPWFLLGRTRVRHSEVRDRERSFLWVNPEHPVVRGEPLAAALRDAMSHSFRGPK